MALTTWQVYGHRRFGRGNRPVYMLVDAPEPPCPADRENHFEVAYRIAGYRYCFTDADNIGKSPPGYDKHVLLRSPVLFGQPQRPNRPNRRDARKWPRWYP
jgi:hypothetical protein